MPAHYLNNETHHKELLLNITLLSFEEDSCKFMLNYENPIYVSRNDTFDRIFVQLNPEYFVANETGLMINYTTGRNLTIPS